MKKIIIAAAFLICGCIYFNKKNPEKILSARLKDRGNKTIEITNSNHFILYKRPDFFLNKIDAFLR